MSTLKDLIRWNDYYDRSEAVKNFCPNKPAFYTFLKIHRAELLQLGAVQKLTLGIFVDQNKIEDAMLEVVQLEVTA